MWKAPTWFSERLHKEFPQLEVVHLSSYDDLEADLRDAEIAIAWSIRPEQFKIATKLRWIHSPAAAVHQLIFPELLNSAVILTNSSQVHGPVVAEHVIALLFALAKRLPDAFRFQEKHIWGQEPMWRGRPRPRELAGATVGLVGLGSIGQEVAKRTFALGMRIIAAREHPEKGSPEHVDQVFPSSQIDALLSQSDYVILAAPLTPATRSLMNASRFARMKPDACLINVSRGVLVDEAALAQALREKKIGGAALDVFAQEPLPPDSPLWDLENLLITPHTAALTEKLWERHYKLFAENLRRYVAHQPLLAVVDKQRGY
ncbi:MAG: hypothetical protein AUH15_03570 [Acidobacteriales bacterium 13_2_20CM_55_8]|nr:MAG: hypothetical protein AUH15_03570 [Acidobacteriales bacterium 13_2_20CM_55_8]